MMKVLLVLVCAAVGTAGSFSRLIPVAHPWEYSFKDVAQLSDGSFAVTVGMVMEDPVLIHFSSSGEILSENNSISVAGRGLEGGGWIIPADDGGCYVVAYSEPRATGADSDVALFKFSSEMTEEWYEVIGSGTDSVYTCYTAEPGAAGGCVLVGGSGYGERMFIREYSPTGEMLWERDYFEYPEYTPGKAVGTTGGTLAVFTDRWNEVTCFMIDSQGNTEWTLQVPYAAGNGPLDVIEVDDGFVVYVSADRDVQRGAIIRINSSGKFQDLQEIDHGVQVRDVLLEDRGMVVFAGSRSIDGEEGAVLEAWDYYGNLNWSRRMDTPGKDSFEAVALCSDQQYVLLGSCLNEEGEDTLDFVLIKTGPDGIVPGGADGDEIPVPSEIGEAASLVPGWVLACGVFDTQDLAIQYAKDVHDQVGLGLPDALWIPGWNSLSGYEGWLGFLHSLPLYGTSDEQLLLLREACPDAYMVWVGALKPSENMTIEEYGTR